MRSSVRAALRSGANMRRMQPQYRASSGGGSGGNSTMMMGGGVVLVGAAGAAYYFMNQEDGAAKKPAPKNAAYVFVKPHAVTPKVQELVKEGLEAKGIKILGEGDLSSETIDEKKLIDQHYYAIASKATILKPHELNVPADKFKGKFGLEWKDALDKKVVFNAMDACKELNVDAAQLKKLGDDAKACGNTIKFGGGFYCSKISHKKKTVYVFNPFFMSMRGEFTKPGLKIHYYNVEWEPEKLSWADFRGKLLGPTDPKQAPADSLRGKVLANWKGLGLKSEPNMGDNAVHASASPFEGLAERMNWLETPCKKDDYCNHLLAQGIPEDVIKAWSVDPQVKVDGDKKGSLFDALEDLDASQCTAEAVKLHQLNK